MSQIYNEPVNKKKTFHQKFLFLLFLETFVIFLVICNFSLKPINLCVVIVISFLKCLNIDCLLEIEASKVGARVAKIYDISD